MRIQGFDFIPTTLIEIFRLRAGRRNTAIRRFAQDDRTCFAKKVRRRIDTDSIICIDAPPFYKKLSVISTGGFSERMRAEAGVEKSRAIWLYPIEVSAFLFIQRNNTRAAPRFIGELEGLGRSNF